MIFSNIVGLNLGVLCLDGLLEAVLSRVVFFFCKIGSLKINGVIFIVLIHLREEFTGMSRLSFIDLDTEERDAMEVLYSDEDILNIPVLSLAFKLSFE